MPKLSRKGDTNTAGGQIERGSSTVFANGKPVGLHVSKITPHRPWNKKQHPPHHRASTTSGSPTVFADGVPVLKEGSSTTCGHSINQGSPDVFVP